MEWLARLPPVGGGGVSIRQPILALCTENHVALALCTRIPVGTQPIFFLEKKNQFCYRHMGQEIARQIT